MDLVEFIEFLKCLSPLGIQWVLEWWHITNMVNRGVDTTCCTLYNSVPIP